jgi:hypothetical protein
MQPGETRSLLIEASEPSSVEIRCFVEKPPPPGYRGCPECGTLKKIANNREVSITASRQIFGRSAGYLELTIIDATEDRRVIRLAVERDTDAEPGIAKAVAIE